MAQAQTIIDLVRQYTTPIISVVAVVLVIHACQERDARIAAEAVAEIRADSLVTALEAIAKRGEEIEAQQRENAILIRERDSVMTVARKRLAMAGRQSDSLRQTLDSALAVLPDTSVIPMGVRILRQEVGACRLGWAACDSIATLQRQQIRLAQERIEQLEPALVRMREFWREAEKRASPNFWKQLSSPLVTVALVVGVVLGALSR